MSAGVAIREGPGSAAAASGVIIAAPAAAAAASTIALAFIRLVIFCTGMMFRTG